MSDDAKKADDRTGDRAAETVARLEVENRRLEAYVRTVEAVCCENERMQTTIRDLKCSNSHLSGEIRLLHSRFDSLRNEHDALAARYESAIDQNETTAALYTASFGLHAEPTREAVLTAIHDIIVNLVGSEEFAILERDARTGETLLIRAVGVDWRQVEYDASVDQHVKATLHRGEVHVRSSASTVPGELTACIPLRMDDRIIGAVAVFGLLQQKPALKPVDHEIFGLLEAQAGTALYLSSLNRVESEGDGVR
jgi:hypothetical protein